MIVILPHYILFNFWCMTNTTHMIISLWGLSLFLSSIESSWLCIIVIAFVQMCANSMLNICSLFQELKISWLYLHEKKTHSLIIHTTCACWNSSMRPCWTFFQYQLISTMSFFISLLNFYTILKWNALDFSTYGSIEMIDTIGSELCIASPHMLKIIFQVDWLEIHWNSNHILNQLHTYCILYHRRVTLKSIVRFIFYLYIPRWISLLFFFRLLFSTMFRSFRSFFFSFSSHNPVYRSISIYFFSSHFWKREIFSVVNIKWKMMEKQKQQPVKTVFFFLFHWPCATTV